MHIRMIVNKEKEENNMKKEKQSKQTKNAIKSVANIQEYNSKATWQFRNKRESVKVGNSTVQLRNVYNQFPGVSDVVVCVS